MARTASGHQWGSGAGGSGGHGGSRRHATSVGDDLHLAQVWRPKPHQSKKKVSTAQLRETVDSCQVGERTTQMQRLLDPMAEEAVRFTCPAEHWFARSPRSVEPTVIKADLVHAQLDGAWGAEANAVFLGSHSVPVVPFALDVAEHAGQCVTHWARETDCCAAWTGAASWSEWLWLFTCCRG